MKNDDRYLAIVRWAQRRYARAGWVTISVGGAPSIYSRIEAAAARCYLGAPQ